jgi:hypothetical protein
LRGRADNKHRLGVCDLDLQWCAQWTRREDTAIADGAASIDDQDGKVLRKRRVLKSVVHYNHIRPVALRDARAREAVASDNGRRKFGQEERLVADVGCAMEGRINLHGTGETPAVTARQKEEVFVLGKQNPADGERGRRLAGTARCEVANTNDGAADFLSRQFQPEGRHRAVDAAEGSKQPAALCSPPKARFAH